MAPDSGGSSEPTMPVTSSVAGARAIVNRVSGERIVIRLDGSQTGGRLLAFDLFLPPGGHVSARQVHPIQSEEFTIVQGRIRFSIGRCTIQAEPGQTVLVPPATPHSFGNAGRDAAQARVEVRRALRTEALFEACAAMTGAGGLFLGLRLLRPSDLAWLLMDFQREIAVADLPVFLVKPVLSALWSCSAGGLQVAEMIIVCMSERCAAAVSC
jgi:quercetin dioxygenase-like cupin family protein